MKLTVTYSAVVLEIADRSMLLTKRTCKGQWSTFNGNHKDWKTASLADLEFRFNNLGLMKSTYLISNPLTYAMIRNLIMNYHEQ